MLKKRYAFSELSDSQVYKGSHATLPPILKFDSFFCPILYCVLCYFYILDNCEHARYDDFSGHMVWRPEQTFNGDGHNDSMCAPLS